MEESIALEMTRTAGQGEEFTVLLCGGVWRTTSFPLSLQSTKYKENMPREANLRVTRVLMTVQCYGWTCCAQLRYSWYQYDSKDGQRWILRRKICMIINLKIYPFGKFWFYVDEVHTEERFKFNVEYWIDYDNTHRLDGRRLNDSWHFVSSSTMLLRMFTRNQRSKCPEKLNKIALTR